MQFLGNAPGPNGKITFSMDGDILTVIGANGYTTTAHDSQLYKIDGKTFLNVESLRLGSDFLELEIPAFILQARDDARKEFKLSKNSIGYTDCSHGKVYFSLDQEGRIVARIGEKEAIADKIEEIETKNAINVQALGIDTPFIEVPSEVVKEFTSEKNAKIMGDLHLIYAGRSLLTGVDYYAFNSRVPPHEWNRVKNRFVNFGEGNGPGLKGWLTSEPEKAEDALRLKKNRVSDRSAEIEKQKRKALASQKKEFPIERN